MTEFSVLKILRLKDIVENDCVKFTLFISVDLAK